MVFLCGAWREWLRPSVDGIGVEYPNFGFFPPSMNAKLIRGVALGQPVADHNTCSECVMVRVKCNMPGENA